MPSNVHFHRCPLNESRGEHMSRKDINLRKRCEAIMGNIELPRPFSVDALCRRLTDQRGRRLHLHLLPREVAVSGICGVWLATASDDHVFYEGQTSPVHQEHIVLHEIGHILFEHNTMAEGMVDSVQTLLPDLDPARFQGLFARTDYTTRQEQEAEMFASLIRLRVDQPHDDPPSEVLARLESALGFRASNVG
jgi:hypothetical protein